MSNATSHARSAAEAPVSINGIDTDDSIERFMTPSPRSIGKDQKLARAHQIMREHQLRHLPVLEEGRLIGILSQRDLYFLESIRGVDPDKDLVEDAMTTDTFSVRRSASLRQVVSTMAERKLGSAVVAEGGRVVGVFTTTDALRVLASLVTRKVD